MLRRNSFKKYIHYSLFIIHYLIISCYSKEDKYNSKRKQYITFSKDIIGQRKYDAVYTNASDSIKTWAKEGLNLYEAEQKNKWFIDSLICFNRTGNKCIMALCRQNVFYKDQEGDGINFFYGVEVDLKWYFFKGAYIVLPRSFYQKATHVPLPVEKLHQIALDNVFRGYLKKKDKGFWGNLFGKTEWEVNEAFFQGMAPKNQASSGYGSCFECKTEEEYFLYLIKKNWGSRDTTNYEQSSTQ